MSEAPSRDGNKLFKGAIRRYFVKSLLQDLGKLHMLMTNTEMQVCIQNESIEIRKEVEQMTNFLVAIDEWENRVLDSFSMIKRCTSRKMGDDYRRKMVGNILVEIKELKKVAPNIITFRPVEETPDKPLKRGTSEVGESSNSNVKDTSSMKTDRYLEKFNAQQMELLRCLAIFPENTELKKRLLVHWWIGLGLLPYEGDTSVMENQYVDMFQKLEEMNILKPKRVREHTQLVDSYTIDPTTHEELILDLKEKKRIIESEETKGLCLYKNDKDEVVALLNLNKKHFSNYINIEPTVKVAQLGKWRYTELEVHNKNAETIHGVAGTKFLENMGEAVTYLSLRGISRIEELHESIGKMRGLKILDLKDCHSLQKLPQKPKPKVQVGVSSDDSWFKELKHLDITGCYLLYHMPKWVCELSNLQVLKGAVFNGFIPKGEEPCRLKDISKLQKLRKLSIKIINPHLLSPHDCTGLQQLSTLLVLTITWGRCGTGEQITNVSRNNLLFGGRKTPTIYFPNNLEKLDIRCNPNAEAQELSNAEYLKRLKRLYIRGGKLTKFGTNVNWKVEILRLRFMELLDLHWHELRNKFTKLKYVEFKNCPHVKCYATGHTGPFNDDEPILSEYSGPVKLRFINYYIEENIAVANLDLTTSGMSVSDIVMVLDIRRSMEGENLAIMKTAMLSLLEGLTIDCPKVRLSIVTFGIDTKGWPLCLITENSRREIENLINGFTADGSTRASDGLQMGLKVLKDRQYSTGRVPIILFVSGSNNIDDAAQVPTGDVFMHTVGIGYNCDREVLEFVAANNTKRLVTYVRNTSDALEFYRQTLVSYYHLAANDMTFTFIPIKGAPIIKQWDEEACAYLPPNHNIIKIDNFRSLYDGMPQMRVILLHYSDVAEIRYSYKYMGIQFEGYCRVYHEGPNIKLILHPDGHEYISSHHLMLMET